MIIRVYDLFRFLVFANLSKFLTASQGFRKRQADSSSEAGPRLFLTPLLEDGRIAEARTSARISESEMNGIESYSGYLTVNKTYNSNLFFWYFPSKGNPSKDPLLLWLQGGPGSSIYAIFTENGPLAVTKSNTLELRDISWVDDHNVLYIDNPVNAGFSFTDDNAGYPRSMDDIAVNVYKALHQFFVLFPELRVNEFFITGESLAGKYIPALGYLIHNENQNIAEEKKINLIGLAIGNGWTDPGNQIEYAEYLYQLGLTDANGRELLRKLFKEIQDLIKEERYPEATEKFGKLLRGGEGTPSIFKNLAGFDFIYNYLYDKEPERFVWYEKWIQETSVRKALHAGDQEFFSLSPQSFQFMPYDTEKSQADHLAVLLEHYVVLLFFGQMDLAISLSSSRNYIRKLNWSGAEEYKVAVRNKWFVDDELAGYSKCARNLNKILIRNAGHMVPADQPTWASAMIKQFTRQKSMCSIISDIYIFL